MADDEEKTVTTAAEFHRQAVRSWLDLPGIERLPKFYRLCKQIVKNGDVWLKKNSAKIQAVENARDVRLFLIRNHAIGFLGLAEHATNATDAEVRQAARNALSQWFNTEEGVQFLAEESDFFDWISANKERIEFLYAVLPQQPAVLGNAEELDTLIRWSYLGEYGKVDGAFKSRFSKIKAWWKQNLGIPAYRRSKARERIMYRKAARLKTQRLSWSAVAQKVDPAGYKANRTQCIGRIRKAVGSLRRIKPKAPFE